MKILQPDSTHDTIANDLFMAKLSAGCGALNFLPGAKGQNGFRHT